MEVNGYCQLWLPTFFKYILFCAQQKKETHKGLEQVDGE